MKVGRVYLVGIGRWAVVRRSPVQSPCITNYLYLDAGMAVTVFVQTSDTSCIFLIIANYHNSAYHTFIILTKR